ncbi:hypothetical protein KCP74_21345 [Salmonella enterica subsp. enterica]|nr:hypothetical protein KCP74_21345 [Salmonella enterica subsp. enterica]
MRIFPDAEERRFVIMALTRARAGLAALIKMKSPRFVGRLSSLDILPVAREA